MKTAVSEAVTNAIVHAYPDTLGKVELKLRLYPGNELELIVRDWGVGIPDIEQARTPLFTTGNEERSGMGFTIMESFMDAVKVRSTPGKGTTVTMRKRFALRAGGRRDPHRDRHPPPGRPGRGTKGPAACLVEENQGLIWSVVKRYARKGQDSEDLYQLGCLGFLKAVHGFDLAFGTQFSTYAVPKIAGEIRRFLRDDGPVKVSRGQKEQALAIHRARNQLTAQLGREPTLSELAQATGLTPEDIAAADLATAAVTSPPGGVRRDRPGLGGDGGLPRGGPGGAGGPAHRHRPPAPQQQRMLILFAVLQGAHPGQDGKDIGGEPGAGLPAGEKGHPVPPAGAPGGLEGLPGRLVHHLVLGAHLGPGEVPDEFPGLHRLWPGLEPRQPGQQPCDLFRGGVGLEVAHVQVPVPLGQPPAVRGQEEGTWQ